MFNDIDLYSILQGAENKLKSLADERKECEAVILLSNKMLNIHKYIPLISIVIGILKADFNIMNPIMYTLLRSALIGFLGSLPIVLISSLYFGCCKKIYNKKIKNIDMDMSIIMAFKKELEDEIYNKKENEQEKTIDFIECQIIDEDIVLESNKKKVKKLSLRKRKK